MSSASVRPPNCRRADLGQPVGLRVAARAQVDEPLVLAAAGRRGVADHGGGVGDDEPPTPDLEQMRAAAVRSRDLPPGDRGAVEVHLEQLVDALAAGRRDLQRDLGWIARSRARAWRIRYVAWALTVAHIRPPGRRGDGVVRRSPTRR